MTGDPGTVAVAIAARFHRYLRQDSTLHGQAESKSSSSSSCEWNRMEAKRIESNRMDLLVMLFVAPRQNLGWEVGRLGCWDIGKSIKYWDLG